MDQFTSSQLNAFFGSIQVISFCSIQEISVQFNFMKHVSQAIFVQVSSTIHSCRATVRSLHMLRQSRGTWRRKNPSQKMPQAEVAMAKNNMSFQGGLWWLRHIVGLRALNRPNKARERLVDLEEFVWCVWVVTGLLLSWMVDWLIG